MGVGDFPETGLPARRLYNKGRERTLNMPQYLYRPFKNTCSTQ